MAEKRMSEGGISMNYKKHRKELLADKSVREEYDKLLPEHELVKSIIEQRIKKKMSQKIADALDSRLIIKLQAKKTG